MTAATAAAAEGHEQAGSAQVEDSSRAAAAVAALLQRVQDAAAAARREGRLAEAVRLCTDAQEAAQSAACGARVVSDVLAERSAAHAALCDSERALEDAQAAVYAHASEQARAAHAPAPAHKGAPAAHESRRRVLARTQSLFCLGQALSALQRHANAERAYAAALRLDEARCAASNTELGRATRDDTEPPCNACAPVLRSDRLRGVLETASAPAAAELFAVKAEVRARAAPVTVRTLCSRRVAAH